MNDRTRPVVPEEDLIEEAGVRYAIDGKPFTGFGVDLRDGRIDSLSEIQDGFDHGYGFDVDEVGRPRYVEQHYSHALHGLVAEWDRSGRLIKAERYEAGYPTQELIVDPVTGARHVVDHRMHEQAIRAARARRTPLPPMTSPVTELLAQFEAAAPALLDEAGRALRRHGRSEA